MSSSRSSRSKKPEGSTRVKLLAKETNGTDDDTEDQIEINSGASDDEGSSASDKPKKQRESSFNRAGFSMPDDLKKLMERVTCCSCGKQLNPMNHGAVRKHPWLKVVTCKKCYKFLRSGAFTRDDEGIDEQCRWCGDGGRLYGCDFCHNCFCRHCIKRNMGRSEAAMMEDDDGSKWHCYICKPKKIRKLRDDCEKILGYIEAQDKKEKEKAERAKQREKEKLEKSREKSREKSKKEEKEKDKDKTDEKDKDKKDEKSTPKRGFPAPKGKSQIAEELKLEKKEASPSKAMSVSQSAPDLIVVGDGPAQSEKLHHRAVNYRPDARTGVQHVQKLSSNVTAVTVGPKNDKPVVQPFASTKGGGMPRQSVLQKPLLMGMLTTNTGPSKGPSNIDRMLVKKKPPLNDMRALKDNIFPYNVEEVAEKMSTMAQSLNLTLNSLKTDLAIAKLSQSNMFQARQMAAAQMKNGLDYFFNNIRELLNVQITAQNPDNISEDKSQGDAKPLSSSSLTSTPISKQGTLVNSMPGKLNESLIPIEIDASPVKKAEGKTEKMETDEDVVIVTDSDTQEMKVLHVKNDKVVKEEEASGEVEKSKGKENDAVDEIVLDEDSPSESESKKETVTASNDTDDKNKKKAVNDEENDEPKGTDDDNISKKETDESEKAKQIENITSADSKADNITDDAESTESTSKSKLEVSENTAAELELLKEMADELNELEEKSKDSDQPRRSSRTKNLEQSEAKNESDKESPVRRSSRQRQKPEDESTEKKDKRDKSSPEKGKTDSKKADKTQEVTEEKDEEDVSVKEDKSKKKAGGKSKISYESEDENNEEEPDKRKGNEDKGKEKNKIAKGQLKSSDSKTLDEDSDDNTEEEVPENKNNTKSVEKSSKNLKKQAKSGDTKSNEDSDENTEEEVPESKSAKSNEKSSKNTKKQTKSGDKSKTIESDEETEEEIPDKKKKSGEGDSKGSKKSNKIEEVEDNTDDMAMEDQVPTDMSDTTESSDESVQEFGKKKKKRKTVAKEESSKRRTRQSGKKSENNTENSDSDPNFDSDLEKEIKSLSKDTRLTRKKAKESADSKKESKGKKEKSKGMKAAKDNISDLSSTDEEGKSPKRRTRQSEKKSENTTENSDTDPDFDSDLEKESESLSKDTRLSRSKTKESKESKKEEGKSKKEKSKEKEDKKKRKVADGEESSSYIRIKIAGKAVLEDESDDDDDRPDDLSSDSSDDPEVSFPKLSTPKKGKGKKKHDVEEFSEDSDFITPKKKRKRGVVRDKLLDVDISDSEGETGKKGKGKKGKRKRKKEDSDAFSEISDEEENRKKGKKRRRIKKIASSDEEKNPEDEDGSDMEDDGTPGGFAKRKQIRKVIGSKKLTDQTKAAQKAEEERRKRIEERQKEYNTYVEVEGGEEEEEEVPEGTEREIHTPVKKDSIAQILGSPRKVPVTTKCVLEMDKEKKKNLIEVDRTLVRKLKPHQVEAVRFMYNCCVESIHRLKKGEGSGCILAHCMGLGKTLSVITFVHTMLSNVKLTKMTKCLVVCPLNTCLNWVNEFEIWLDDVDFEIEVYEMSKVKQNFERAQMLKEWHEGGAGVMILGYDMYRNLVNGSHCKNKKQKKIFYETLAQPGPDIVVCDEGHILKNDATSLSKSMMKIETRKRIVLTGTPLQNNLGEYHCMVDFVKPALLGTRKEFNNRFCNPIINGQCSDSTPFDVKLMKRRAHILHELLAGCVQRKDYSALTKFLPPKFEYVISVRLSKVQMSLYEKYLEMNVGGTTGTSEIRSKGARLFTDYQALMRIWTHPWVLKLDEIRQENKRQFDDTDDDDDSFINDSGSDEDSFVDDSTTSSSNSSDEDNGNSSDRKKKKKRKTRGDNEGSSSDQDSKKENGDEVVKKWTSKRRGNEEGAGSSWMEDMGYSNGPKELTSEWWAEFVKEEDEFKLELSGKMTLMFEILKMCEDIGDKVLVFSQSLLSLDIIEDFLAKVDEANNPTNEPSEADKDKEKDKPSTSEASGSGEPVENGTEKSEEEKNKEKLKQYGKSWSKGLDYFRMDGSTNSQNRKASQDMFNDPENYRARLFLISTKAGSLGINLVSANRVIIFDASWNPSHDIQSIFRVYRFGQVKPVYVYRFLAQGTMEEKIYERQVTKQSLSQRVVDEHQIERHFTSADLQELYKFQPERLDDPEKKSRPLPMLPKDHMLAELMTNNKEWIVTYHEHDSLLENVVEQELTEEEKKAAWEDYEDEKKGISKAMGGFQMNPAMLATQQMNMQNLLLQGQANLGQAAVLQIVQDLKARFPNLPPEVFQQRVQAVLRQVLTQQIMQQSDIQRRQLEQQRMNELNRLNQIKQQIQRQQAMISNQQRGFNTGMPMLQSMLPQGLRPQTMNQLQMRPSSANFDQQKK
ncbi:transcriptional regulator ATRX-like [Mercenaria mercenaria]|uniref:transcriptional regulator ATRX-like n=1 Tax=Mercenaria mercenaria TaxID=6596 RepID=UPI00234F60FD|nr:transcriptional regulator ATRX-like [Mercenaria mercenaria]